MGLEDHLYAAEVSDGLFGQFAIFTCVKAHTVDEIDSRIACSQFLAYLNPEPFIREQIAKEIMEKCKKEIWTIYTDIGNFEVTGCPQETGEDGTILACSHVEDAQIVGGRK